MNLVSYNFHFHRPPQPIFRVRLPLKATFANYQSAPYLQSTENSEEPDSALVRWFIRKEWEGSRRLPRGKATLHPPRADRGEEPRNDFVSLRQQLSSDILEAAAADGKPDTIVKHDLTVAALARVQGRNRAEAHQVGFVDAFEIAGQQRCQFF